MTMQIEHPADNEVPSVALLHFLGVEDVTLRLHWSSNIAAIQSVIVTGIM